MNNNMVLRIILFLIVSLSMSACQESSASPAAPTLQPTANIPTPTSSPEPTPDYRQLSEEVLAAHIHETVVDMDANASQAVRMTAAMSDKRLTDEEHTALLMKLNTVQADIDLLRSLADAYRAQYAEISPETSGWLGVLDETLNGIADRLAVSLDLMLPDPEMTEANRDELGKTVALLQNQTTDLKTESEIWLADVQTHINEREKLYANTSPQQSLVTYNRIDAFTQTHDFLDALTASLEDGKISTSELAAISQLAANAEASLYNTGDPQLIAHARQVDALMSQASRGEWAAVNDGLVELTFSLPARPRP